MTNLACNQSRLDFAKHKYCVMFSNLGTEHQANIDREGAKEYNFSEKLLFSAYLKRGQKNPSVSVSLFVYQYRQTRKIFHWNSKQ